MGMPKRLTEEMVNSILAKNEGLRIDKRIDGRNSHEWNSYMIKGGEMLLIRKNSITNCDLGKKRRIMHENADKFTL